MSSFIKTVKSNFIFNTSDYNILIVEDSKSVNKILVRTFSDLNYNCFSSFCLKDAYHILQNKKIDFIMLDIHLPDGNSYELIKKLENSSEKIFVLTTESDTQFRDLAYQKGVIDFIVKGKEFLHKILEISKTIEKLEKNRLITILIIDDSFVVQEQIKDIFENRLFKIQIACDGKEALSILKKQNIDLILLDLELKYDNGIDFLKKHKTEIISIRKIPVMIISGNITSSVTREALRNGAVDIIKKPYIIEELILKVDLWIDYKRKDEELVHSRQILQEYKDSVDKISIVSKTNSRGIITYVNDNFCEISGYKREELLGKNHNIVRHEDILSSTFKDVWHTISILKKAWQGNIKNKRKDGTFYWVKALIKPILNKNNEVLEYIGLRTDITEDIQINDYFKNKLDTTVHNLKDAIHLSKEYENAINESNILSRLDLNFNYTYVNDKFCLLTGFNRNELLGKSQSIVLHKDFDILYVKELQETVKAGKVWKGIVHNKSKNGKSYWLNTTALPIENEKKETIEYLIIRQDITELFELHKEIEETQREIIYKMGVVAESRSKETGNHVKRVATYSKELALLAGLSKDDAHLLFTASPMHDIGKVGIADEILNKPDKLTKEESTIMKTHAQIGFDILKDSNKPILQAAALVALTHHEKWDGSGYPKALKGEDIHIFGRITAIADVFDALGNERVYKKAWENEDIVSLFAKQKGKHFDPNLIDLFINNLPVFLKIRNTYIDYVD